MGGGGGGGAAPLPNLPAATVADATEKSWMRGQTGPDGFTYDPNRIGFGSQIPPHYEGYQDVGNFQKMSPWTPGYMDMGGGALPGMPNAGFLPMQHNQTWGGGYAQQGYPMGSLGPNENPFGAGNWGPMGGYGGGMPGFGGGQYGHGGSSLYGQQQPPAWWGNPDGQYGGPPEGLPMAGGYQGGYDPYNPTGYATQNNPYGFFNGFDFANLFQESQDYLTDYNPYRQPMPEPVIPEEEADQGPQMKTRMQPVYSYNEFGRREMIGMKEVEYMEGQFGDPNIEGGFKGQMEALQGQLQDGSFEGLQGQGNRQDPRFAARMHQGDIWHRQAQRQGTGQYA